MKLKETFTQEDLWLILPSKIALMADIISKKSGDDPVKIMTDFYQSNTYKLLQVEATKYWWFGPAQLGELFTEEKAQRDKQNMH